jgi:arginine metabolism regulation protein II
MPTEYSPPSIFRYTSLQAFISKVCLLTNAIEADQRKMTRMITAGLEHQSASATLARLENGSANALRLEGAIFKGPFGVQVLPNPASANNNQDEPHSDQIEHDLLEWDPLWPAIAGDSATFDGLYDVPGSSGNATILDPVLDVMNDRQSLLPPSLGTDLDELIYQPTSLSLAPIVPSLEVSRNKNIPPQAAELLRYFKVNVISLSFPLKNRRQCPWQAVHLPAAISAFAELSIHHTTSHTRMSLFYSLLAASCLNKYAREQSASDLEISAKWFKETPGNILI